MPIIIDLIRLHCSLHVFCVMKYTLNSVCNLSDYPTKVGFWIFCRISSDYEKYASSLSDFNIF